MQLFDKLSQKAKEHPQRIVLPEGTEPRTLTAANRIIADGLAHIILIGDPKEVLGMAQELKLDHIKYATIVNPADQAVIDRYAPLFFELRKSKGISMEQARLTTANPLYLGCLMVKNGDADGTNGSNAANTLPHAPPALPSSEPQRRNGPQPGNHDSASFHSKTSFEQIGVRRWEGFPPGSVPFSFCLHSNTQNFQGYLLSPVSSHIAMPPSTARTCPVI